MSKMIPFFPKGEPMPKKKWWRVIDKKRWSEWCLPATMAYKVLYTNYEWVMSKDLIYS